MAIQDREGSLGRDRDFGYTKEQIDLFRRMMRDFSGAAGNSTLDTAGTLLAVAVNQIPFADQRTQNNTKEQARIRRRTLFTNIKRQVVSKKGAGVVLAGGAVIWGFDTFFSPRTQPQRDAANKSKAEAERNRRLEFEKELVTNEPSVESALGWRFRYPKHNPDITFVEYQNTQPNLTLLNTITTVGNTYNILFTGKAGTTRFSRETGVRLSLWDRVEGGKSIKITAKNGTNEDSYLLRDEPTADLDTSVVLLENVNENLVVPVEISLATPPSASFPIFRVKLMQAVSTQKK